MVSAPTARAELESHRAPSPLPPLLPLPSKRPPRVLSFDIENRPLSYWYDGRCTAEVTAIAWAWTDSSEWVESRCLGDDRALVMLEDFREAYDEADIVTGHYIRKHDLPILCGALVEFDRPPLGAKLTCDTRLDLVRWSDLPKSQEALGDMLGLESPKEHMSQADWRDANRLTRAGVEETRRRVTGDVRQHCELRAALLDRGLLGAPRWWSPGGARRKATA